MATAGPWQQQRGALRAAAAWHPRELLHTRALLPRPLSQPDVAGAIRTPRDLLSVGAHPTVLQCTRAWRRSGSHRGQPAANLRLAGPCTGQRHRRIARARQTCAPPVRAGALYFSTSNYSFQLASLTLSWFGELRRVRSAERRADTQRFATRQAPPLVSWLGTGTAGPTGHRRATSRAVWATWPIVR